MAGRLKMKMPLIFLLLVISVILTIPMVPGGSHEMARDLAAEGAILPLEEVLEKVRGIQPGRVLEVELEKEHDRFVYEIEMLNPSGEVWEVNVDAASGEILKRERED
jgi:uncharacterized membrane protein YkoI